MNTEQAIDELFDTLHDLLEVYAKKGVTSRDVAHVMLTVSYDVTHNFGPKGVDPKALFVSMAKDCVENMYPTKQDAKCVSCGEEF